MARERSAGETGQLEVGETRDRRVPGGVTGDSRRPVATERQLSELILEAVASLKNCRVSELPVPLYDAIDPEALDAVFRNTSGAVSFEYDGTSVTVTDQGHVSVTPSG